MDPAVSRDHPEAGTGGAATTRPGKMGPAWPAVPETLPGRGAAQALASVRGSWLLTTALLGFWVLPLIVLRAPLDRLHSQEEAWQQRQVQSRLREEMQYLRGALEPRLQATLHLQRLAADLNEEIGDVPDWVPLLQAAARRRAVEFRTLLPHSTWFCLSFDPVLNASATTFAEASQVLFAGGPPSSVSEADWRKMLCAFISYLAGGFLDHHGTFDREMDDRLRIKGLKHLAPASLVSLATLKIGDRPVYLFWSPFFRPSFWQKHSPETLRFPGYLQRSDLFFPGCLGGFMAIVDPQDLGQAVSARLALRDLARRGTQLAILPGGGEPTEPVVLSPVFLRNPALVPHLRGSGGDTDEAISAAGWEILRGPLFQDQRQTAVLARPREELPHGLLGLQKLADLGTVVWILAGLWLASRFRTTGGWPYSLRGKLPAAFLIPILPALLLGILSLEASFLAHDERFALDQDRVLAETLRAVDEGQECLHGWEPGIFHRLTRRPSFLREIHGLEPFGRKAGRKAEAFAIRFARLLTGFGIANSPWILTGPNELFVADERRATKQGVRVMSYWYLPILRMLNPRFDAGNSSIAPGEMLIGVGVDAFLSFMLSIMPPERLAEVGLAPESLAEIWTQETQSRLNRRYLSWKGAPRYAFQADLNSPSGPSMYFDQWNRWGVARPGGPLTLWVVEPDQPGVLLIPPYWWRGLQGDGSFEAKAYEFFAPPDVAACTTIAGKAGLPARTRTRLGGEEYLVLARPGEVGKKRMPVGLLPIERLARLEGIRRRMPRLLLLFLLLTSVWLAITIARRFLGPVLSLSDACQAIMREDFTVSLPTTWRGEFARLAQAFNVMATGVREGKLLSRFVSESVRTAAADEERGRAAAKGESREATVMFAGLVDFKHLMHDLPPQELVVLLNRHLEAMSGAIRAHGGEIDKFIGDKILAVFPPETLGGGAEAARAAVRAAEAMVAAWSRLAGLEGHPLGVGIVTGPVLAGILGTPDVRLEYTVLGDTVNLASRLGDVAQRIDHEGRVRPAGAGQIPAVVVEAGTRTLVLASREGQALGPRLGQLELPPIKGKTRSVEAFLLKNGDALPFSR